MTDPFDTSGANPWRTLTSSVVFDNGQLRVREDTVLQPDGEPGRYTYVELPWPLVAVVPLAADGHVYLVRQWRYPWARNSWEIPAGHCEEGEEPLLAAQRELDEEVGLQAASWEPLGTGYGSAGVTARAHLYLARDLAPAATGRRRDGAEQDLIARAVPIEAALRAALEGTIVHPFTVIGLLRAARRLRL